MEMKLIEVALALVVMYLLLALAATHIGELYSAMRGSRHKTLEAVIGEVFRGSEQLVTKFFQYAPIYALSKNDGKPSAIPPDLFATAFLAVLNNGKPPRGEKQTPALFIAELSQLDARLKQILEANAAGIDNWDAFEKKIARWYSDICDRSEGWFKRTSTRQLLMVALVLTLALNADSLFIARTLLENDQLRVSAANIGELIANQVEDDKLREAGKPLPQREKLSSSREPQRLSSVTAELDRALTEIHITAGLMPKLFAFSPNRGAALAQSCMDKADKNAYVSNFDTWALMLPEIFARIGRASLGIDFVGKQQPSIWRQEEVGKAMNCTNAISNWLRMVYVPPDQKDAKEAGEHLRLAVQAMDNAVERMKDLKNAVTVQSNLIKAYSSLGQSFRDCADGAGASRPDFDKCLAEAGSSSVPFGWPSRGGQFCRVAVRRDVSPLQSSNQVAIDAAGNCATPTLALTSCPTASLPWKQCPVTQLTVTACAPPKPPAAPPPRYGLLNEPLLNADQRSGWNAWWGCEDFNGNADLELPVIQARLDGAKLLAAFLGLGLTTVMVSLGAPFWYGVIGKVATLRMAGRVRGLGDAEPDEKVASSSPPSDKAGAAAPLGGVPAPFDSALNEFERAMRPQEISRLQIALNVPPTMHLDEVTRNAFANRLKELDQPPDREVGATTYFMVVGRQTTQSTAGVASNDTWTVGYSNSAFVPPIVKALNKLFPASKGWTELAFGSTYDQQMRARTVLFRFKAESTTAAIAKGVVTLANSANAGLMRLDPATRKLIELKAENKDEPGFARESAPWLDFAYGELGVREDDVASGGASRAEEYLKALSAALVLTPTGSGWCGAFVGWVLTQDRRLASTPKPGDLLKAANWANYGTPTTAPQCGDICIVNGAHVAFFIAMDTNGSPWLLGGNQGDPGVGGVTLVRFGVSRNSFSYVRP